MGARQRFGGAGRSGGQSSARLRGPHGPEHNLIQRPELMKRLADMLGMRQPHVMPALSEGITPVIVVADATRERGRIFPRYRFSAIGNVGDTFTLASNVLLRNPVGSGVRVRVTDWTIQVHDTAGGANFVGLTLLAIAADIGGAGGSAGLTNTEFFSPAPLTNPQASLSTGRSAQPFATANIYREYLGELQAPATDHDADIVLQPGTGLLWHTADLRNTFAVVASGEWEEETL